MDSKRITVLTLLIVVIVVGAACLSLAGDCSNSIKREVLSPNGKMIAYNYTPKKGIQEWGTELQVIAADGSWQKTPKTGKLKIFSDGYPPSWSPDGTKLALTLSEEMASRVYRNLDFFRKRIVMRPQEITNHPEIVRRLGIISMNTAIEIDLGGNVNSTHIMGTQMMNGIGGSGDFTRNAYISIFSCPSTQKGGKISTIVPMVSHMDHSEHSVQIVATENGVADLRGKDPDERAHSIIDRCAHPNYREQLRAYLKVRKEGHAPLSLNYALAMHQRFVRAGDMRGVQWNEMGAAS